MPLFGLWRRGQASIQQYQAGLGGCPRCRRLAQSERQRGPAAEAIADFRAIGLEPLEPYVNVMTPWRSQCRNCGREVTPLLNNIRKGQGGCGWCAGKRLDAEEAVALMRAASLEPLVAYPGHHEPWPCRCLRCGPDRQPPLRRSHERRRLPILQRHCNQAGGSRGRDAQRSDGTFGAVPRVTGQVALPLPEVQQDRHSLLQHNPAR